MRLYLHCIFCFRQVRSLFQSVFSAEYDIMLSLSVYSILSFTCHQVAAYVFFLVYSFLLITCIRRQSLRNMWPIQFTFLRVYSNIYPTRCNFTQFIYIWKLLYMFRVLLPPIIRSAYNCIYSIWYLSHRYCYLPLSWRIAGTVWQIPEAVDAVVCAPDDGWWYHPKHVEQFPDINKLCKVSSCYIGIYFAMRGPMNVRFLRVISCRMLKT